ncbi:PTS lactose/cellobiose transporter subunit IIA [uncultured Cetobacterium sp.]|uniref:PTS lactose/cellobiose transporter subunit IIA n=1 Tax=uncultured Cetobacterium sp. TaxID=527638 RepID=UPI00261B876B|nr:PTS lactose/cellobiose transporter subunit IIA [uncultured Cetobacterium sp.]
MVAFTEEELEEVIFTIIAYAGEAKGFAHQALEYAEEGKFDLAEEAMKECDASVLKAHGVQTDMIQKEACGKKVEFSIVFVHAQDHLMTTLSERELIKKMIKLNKRLFALENK